VASRRAPSVHRHALRVASLLVVALTAIAMPLPADAATAVTKVPGIDVSRWQLDVNWSQVASTSTRYAIMRATIGNEPGKARFIDPKYLEYLAGATANGLVVGAYHRANAGRAPNDAVNEADYFVDNAQIAAGDVLPVLDIEETHGLTVQEMKDWVRAWVQRVLARTGVRPMIYSSPYFWRTNMGNALWFADHGYPLWIAHWGVAAPDVPAENWGGHGWTFWQWTSDGSVAGVPTEVDRDRFKGSQLVHGKIASLTVAPPQGGSITGPRINCGGAATKCARLGNPDTSVTLTATPAPGATLLRWTGACADAGASLTCDVTMLGARSVSAVFGYPIEVRSQGTGAGVVTSAPARLDCGDACSAAFAAGSDVTLTATPDSASAFTGWGGACAGTDPECVVTVNAPSQVVATFDSITTVEQDGEGTAFAWGRAQHAVALGGSYRWERRAGATTSFAFTGGSVTLFTVKGPAMGRGRISIDGAPVATFDGYAPTTRSGSIRFTGLGPGEHEIAVDVLGTKRPAASGTRVAVDALRWGRHHAHRSHAGRVVVGGGRERVRERRDVRDQRGSRRVGEAPVRGNRRLAARPPRPDHGAGGRPGRRVARESGGSVRASADVRHDPARHRARGRSPHRADRRARRAPGREHGERRRCRPLARDLVGHASASSIARVRQTVVVSSWSA
jgi:GH25 family lysozyme M1 (1,4-beta-N-acetylmuramidase)